MGDKTLGIIVLLIVGMFSITMIGCDESEGGDTGGLMIIHNFEAHLRGA